MKSKNCSQPQAVAGAVGSVCGKSVLCPYNFVIGSGGGPVDESVNDAEDQKRTDSAQGKQADIFQGECG